MTYSREQINQILMTNDSAVERAIVRLFELQTADEQSSANTNHQNGRGFGSSDARPGTRFARWLLGMDDNNRVRYAKKSLSHPLANKIFSRYCKDGEAVISRARRIALKHSQQLVIIANGNAQPPKAVVPEVVYNPEVRVEPQPGSWAATARMMAQSDTSGFDWDSWKDQMKDNELGL